MLRKFFIVVSAAFALIGFCATVAGVWYWFTIVRPSGAPLYDPDLPQQDGLAAGRGSPDTTCLAKTLDRLAGCEHFSCTYGEVEFIRACLRAASQTPSFCKGTPSQENEFVGRQWRESQCHTFDGDHQACLDVTYQIQRHCDARRYEPPRE